MRSATLALLYLQAVLIKNWFRRAHRSVIFWVVVAGGVLWLLALLGGGDAPDAAGGWLTSDIRASGAMLILIGSVVVGCWRVASSPPLRIALADAIFVLLGPLPGRVQYGLLLPRELVRAQGALLPVVLGLAFGASIGGGAGRGGDLVLLGFGALLLLLIGQVCRHALWILTERAIVANAPRGHRLRRGISSAAKLAGAGLLAWLLAPLIGSEPSGPRDGLALITDRLLTVAGVPPLSWAAALLTGGQVGGVSAGTGALALGALAAGLVAVAVAAATDFAEPLAVTAERQTDPRGRIQETGTDIHWAAMTQLGATARSRASLPPFGRGAWAILWASLVRWLRFNLATLWVTIVIYGGIGLCLALAIRVGWMPPAVGWGAVIFLPFFGAYSMLLDELRKPFIYLVPAPAWSRLAAAGVTSVLDILIGSILIVALLIGVSGRPLAESAALIVLAVSASVLTQAAVCLIQVVLPFWVQFQIRLFITFSLAMIAALPAALAFALVYAAAGIELGFLAASAVAVLTGAGVLLLAAALFERLEMPS